jgi:putative FmdB family regulatory protein
MPIYEYVCRDCGIRFETLRQMKEADSPIECQECRSVHTERCVTVFNARSGGKAIASGGPTCGSCSSGSCASCGK